MRNFDKQSEREILALAIGAEEEDGRIYAGFAEDLRADYPGSAKVFTEMAHAIVVVFVELAVITWIRWKYMDSPPLSAAMQVGFGGALVFVTGILTGSG